MQKIKLIRGKIHYQKLAITILKREKTKGLFADDTANW